MEDFTNDSAANNKIHKRKLEREGKINCGYCPYHRGENGTSRKAKRSWKRKKKRNQYE